MEDKYSMLFLTLPDTTTADDIAEALVLRKLAASVNIIPEMKTVRATGTEDVEIRPEILLIIRTQRSKVVQLMEFVKLNSPYKDEDMDLTAMSMEDVNNTYLKGNHAKTRSCFIVKVKPHVKVLAAWL